MLSSDKTSDVTCDNLANISLNISGFDSHVFHAFILLKPTNPAVESAPVNAWKNSNPLHLCESSL